MFIPFYPLPYRDKRGGILFPASGYGWYTRDDVLAAIAWLERFVLDFPRSTSKQHRMTAFEIEEAWTFRPGHEGRANERLFDFVRDLFVERRQIKEAADRTGRYDIREKTIKLSLNSIYGKLAQSVGGDGAAPSVANPYYAAATTAYCRRRLIEAALIDPHAIVFFATDGIVSTRPLKGLERVRKKGDVVDLGDWEYPTNRRLRDSAESQCSSNGPTALHFWEASSLRPGSTSVVVDVMHLNRASSLRQFPKC